MMDSGNRRFRVAATQGRAAVRSARAAVLASIALHLVACDPPEASTRSHAILGTAASFTVLAGTTVTNTNDTTVVGNLGVSPGTAVVGFPPGMVTGGTIHAADAVASQAQSDLTVAYNELAGLACPSGNDLTGQDLGGLTLVAGVYCFSSSAFLTGTLTLDAQGDPDALFVFQIGSTLITASGATVMLINGAQACNVYWQVGSSATIGTDAVFAGSILALTSITLQSRATIFGRALARNGAVTMDDNHLEVGMCTTGMDAGVGEPIDAGPAPVEDAGPAPGEDGGGPGPGEDGGMPMADGGPGSIDGGPGPIDAGPPGMDGGPPAMDGGPPAMDGGPPAMDGGPPAMDGGPPAMDGGPPAMDGGPPAMDGGPPAMDGGADVCCIGVQCGVDCVDLDSDRSNCGACGNVCAPSQLCSAGSCTGCPAVCGGECTEITSDRNNCGACGNVCAPSEYCNAGACHPCGWLCGGGCADLRFDRNNCGACGNTCPSGQVCSAASCTECPTGTTFCSGSCVDLSTDEGNCGTCGTSCDLGNTCVEGNCLCL
jgi:hypothetical protein